MEVYYKEIAELPRAWTAENDRQNLDVVRKILRNLSMVGSEVDQEVVKA